MRTTIEISDQQHRALSALANRRGLRGFSALVQEALDSYLGDLGADEMSALLELEGIVDDEQEREIRERVSGLRATWRAS